MTSLAPSELILGGQRSGKSRRAEMLAGHWLAVDAGHRAVLIATALAGDDEMRARIARHQSDRAQRVPQLQTVEEPRALADAIARWSRPDTLVIVDCLTLWLTHRLFPVSVAGAGSGEAEDASEVAEQVSRLGAAVAQAPGPIVLVGNEIGMGVIPMGAEVRAFVDQLGRLNQAMAGLCHRVTLMVAGLPLTVKDGPCKAG